MPDKPFAVLTDSACDLPYDLAEQSPVDILSFGISLDGKAYSERVDFNFDQYYDLLRNSQGLPSTSHIPLPRYLLQFEDYDAAGIEEVLYVSINAGGSNTHDAAVLAAKRFHQLHPESKMRIHVVDSHAYSMAYGWYVVEAARKLEKGASMDTVVAWLEDVFRRVEIVLGAFSLKFMKKSGRISAAAAFAGELLGLRPIVSLNDGVSVVQRKVRGDKDVLPALLDHAAQRMVHPPEYMVGGTDQAIMDDLAARCEKRFGVPPLSIFKLGSAVASNTGPDAIAIVFMGERRARP
ncbi:MAG: DegV family protein [Ruminococcaceae bacterium]|nr:DegV family protein [Oscillospiraceae bacterium]